MLQLQPCQAGSHTGESTCVQRCLLLVQQIMAQHEGIQKLGQANFKSTRTCRHQHHRTEHAKLSKPVLDISPFKSATGTGNVTKMHVLHYHVALSNRRRG